jgi:hypothetical protein
MAKTLFMRNNKYNKSQQGKEPIQGSQTKDNFKKPENKHHRLTNHKKQDQKKLS